MPSIDVRAGLVHQVCLSCFAPLTAPIVFTADWLDGKHVVFGRVIKDGLLVIRKIENVATGPANRPKLPCTITECGEM